MSSNCASEFANVYTTIESISGNMTAYTSNVLSTYSILNQMVSNQSNINSQIFNGTQNLVCGNITNNTNEVGGNVIINSGNVRLSNGNLLLSGKISLGGDYGSAGQVLVSNGNTLPSWRSSMTRGTTQSMNGATTIPLTGIPSWANEIVIMIINGSTNGTSSPILQLGIPSGSYLTTGYSGTMWGNNGSNALNYSTGALLWNTTWAASYVFHAIIRLYNIGGNVWGIQVNSTRIDALPTNQYAAVGSGTVTLTDVLDRVRITTTAGTNTFDAGSINIVYQ
jgi:hypothetical protein